jgi:starch synthase
VNAIDVLSVASEAFPLVKTGGLADVVGALPAALAPHEVRVRTLLPGYPAVRDRLHEVREVAHLPHGFGGPAALLEATAGDLDLLVLDAPHLYTRAGGPYADATGRDWSDNLARFAALSRVAADIGRGLLPTWRPDVVHAHDWQAGLTPAYLAYGAGERRPGSVMTVHNLAFQGTFPVDAFPSLGLPPEAYGLHGVEYYGQVGCLKAGLALADRLTTVSPTYAAEIRTAAHGMGLDGLLRERAAVLSGILNGIDTTVWDPRTDPHIAATYDPKGIAPRRRNTAALQGRLGLTIAPETPVLGMVSRLTWQKGIDLLLAALPAIERLGAQLVVVGTGDAEFERALQAAAAAHPGRIAVHLGYDEALAHQVQAGVDALLVPSRFEPCGLTQLCALRYGAIPVVARVGGLADTVVDANPMALATGAGTGIVFTPDSVDDLVLAVERTLRLRRDGRTWLAMQRRAMASPVGWETPAQHYAALYRALHADAGRRR